MCLSEGKGLRSGLGEGPYKAGGKVGFTAQLLESQERSRTPVGEGIALRKPENP